MHTVHRHNQHIVIDLDLDAIVETLSARPSGDDVAVVRAVVHETARQFDNARVRDFLSVLILKEARDRLRTLAPDSGSAHDQPGRTAISPPESESTARRTAYYSASTREPRVHHVFDDCVAGRLIVARNRREGTLDFPLCRTCKTRAREMEGLDRAS